MFITINKFVSDLFIAINKFYKFMVFVDLPWKRLTLLGG